MPPLAANMANLTETPTVDVESHRLDPLNPRFHPNQPSNIPNLTGWNVTWTVGRVVLFALVFRLLDCPFLYKLIEYLHPDWSSRKRWRLRNEITSLVHALLSGVWAASVFVIFPQAFEDMIWFYHPYAFWLVTFSCGYLINDALDLIYHEQSLRTLELLFHHISIIFALVCAMWSRQYMSICACGLLMEALLLQTYSKERFCFQINSIFLHSRSLLNLCQVDKTSTKYRIISVGNIGTFIIFRLSNNVYLLVWDCLHYSVMAPFFFGVLFFVMFSMLIVNAILFYRVLLADSYLSTSGLSCLLAPWSWVPVETVVRLRRRGAIEEDEDIDDGLGPELHVAQNPAIDNDEVHSHDSEHDVAPVTGFHHLTQENVKVEGVSKRESRLSHDTSSRHSPETHRARQSGFYDMLVPDEEADVIP